MQEEHFGPWSSGRMHLTERGPLADSFMHCISPISIYPPSSGSFSSFVPRISYGSFPHFNSPSSTLTLYISASAFHSAYPGHFSLLLTVCLIFVTLVFILLCITRETCPLPFMECLSTLCVCRYMQSDYLSQLLPFLSHPQSSCHFLFPLKSLLFLHSIPTISRVTTSNPSNRPISCIHFHFFEVLGSKPFCFCHILPVPNAHFRP